MKKTNIYNLLGGIALLALSGTSSATVFTTLDVSNITGNNTTNATTGENQLFIDVSDYTGDGSGGGLIDNQVLFTFRNIGPDASSITQIYFDDGTLLGINTIFNMTGVSFIEDTTPPFNLPGGNTVSFTEDFNADPTSPTQPNGVNPGEQVGILFDLINGKTLQDTLNALVLGGSDPLNDNALRIGFHVQGFDNGGSEAFVNNPPSDGGGGQELPEPSTLLLSALGLIGIGFYGRRRRRD